MEENNKDEMIEEEREASTAEENDASVSEDKEKKKARSSKTEKKLKEELDAAQAKLKETEDKYMRTLAEYDNFRKRSQKEREGVYADAVSDTLENLFPLFDNLMLAAKYTEGDKVAEGVKMILDRVPEILAKLNVTAFGAPGEKFDPLLHNAVMHEEDESRGESEISDVFQLGYKLGDRVIRYATVKVVN